MLNTRVLHNAKAFYFLYYAAWACLAPFLALYYQSLGFSGSQIGVLTGISPLATLFAAPFWGGVADSSRRHRRVLLGAILGAGLSVLVLSHARSFWIIIPIVVGYAFFTAPIIPLVDHSVLALLGSQRDQYGKQRLWGAIGWGIAGPITGWLVSQFGLVVAFPGYLVLAGLSFFVAVRLSITPMERGEPYWRGLGKLLSNRSWFIFLLVVFLGGSGLSVNTNYLFLYMAELNSSSTVMGFALTVATISELPVLFFSGYMTRRWGPRGLLIISLAAFVLRAFGYSVSTAPWQALLLQLFHGLSFSAMWVAGVSFASEIAPPGLGATAQGLFSSTVMGLGGITGALVGGILLDRFGGSGMFRLAAAGVLLGLMLFLAFSKHLNQSKINPPNQPLTNK